MTSVFPCQVEVLRENTLRMAFTEGSVRFFVSVQSPDVEWSVTRERERSIRSIVSSSDTVMFLYVWEWFSVSRANGGGAALTAWARTSSSTRSPAVNHNALHLFNAP
ncbi:MAG: hypothetical protein A4E36_01561 [Methanoregulaceae archaeon PtaB.Bin009]|nr:MAG: hypothetical protein A4E36_01561 [Methanoregulaceae archaeon PtaB.Bin009]OPY41034.1 MAG: hypothetical protein A4E41_01107 [Methanoregulaceae archaeon PtaU1.Bin066]